MKQITHYDLFAGIGGFSLAIDNIYEKENTEHIFVERDEFCQLVLKKHWPKAEYHSCIHEFIADTKQSGFQGSKQNKAAGHSGLCHREYGNEAQTILTGGFPCQPFSTAGRRKGTDDDRYLWPAMFESIKLIRPDWIIAENVAGLVSWSEGLVLEQVCSDLESENYEVQPFIIPACAVNAPHRRDRVWIVANCKSWGRGRSKSKRDCSRKSEAQIGNGDRNGWNKNWLEVATRLCRVDAGLPRRMDRNPRLKALGNAIVPQIAEEIIKSIAKIT